MEGGVCDRKSCARKGSSEGAHVGEGLETPGVQRVWEGAQRPVGEGRVRGDAA